MKQQGDERIAIGQTVTATRGKEMPSITNIVPPQTFRDYVFTGYYDNTGSTATQYYTWDLQPARNWDKSAGEYDFKPGAN